MQVEQQLDCDLQITQEEIKDNNISVETDDEETVYLQQQAWNIYGSVLPRVS